MARLAIAAIAAIAATACGPAATQPALSNRSTAADPAMLFKHSDVTWRLVLAGDRAQLSRTEGGETVHYDGMLTGKQLRGGARPVRFECAWDRVSLHPPVEPTSRAARVRLVRALHCTVEGGERLGHEVLVFAPGHAIEAFTRPLIIHGHIRVRVGYRALPDVEKE